MTESMGLFRTKVSIRIFFAKGFVRAFRDVRRQLKY